MSYGWVMTYMRAVMALAIVGYASNASAQITPAAGYTPPDDGRRRWEPDSLQPVQRHPQLHQHHRQHLAHRRVSDHTGHLARDQRDELAERQSRIPDQVRVRAVQSRRLDDEGLVRPLRHSADALARLRRGHLPVPLPGDDVPRA